MTGAANRLILPDAGAAAIVADVTHYGGEEVETGGFMLAQAGTETVTEIAHAGTRGILRRRDLFQVSELALDALFAYAEANELWIPAQYHSHGLTAFMSDCDVEHGLSVDGFVSVIVPFFADPPPAPSAWGWWCFKGDWLRLAPPVVATGDVAVQTFDEEGVRGR